ncbi:MAG: 23S rRNA (adenine(2503)-C(2))-methyltransferase RlmN [Phycisphaerales bacterium JB059]
MSETQATTPPLSPLGLSRDAFARACAERGFSAAKARTAYIRCMRERDPGALPPFARLRVAPIVRRLDEPCPEGTTTKFVQRLDPPESGRLAEQGVPHLDIESVIIPMLGRTGRKTHTLCVSSQVGCAMGCGFCETAQMGLVRSLTAEEIVGQWWAARELLIEEGRDEGQATINNIVFMGMGEPLDNLDEVLRAIECLTERSGANMAMSTITISTVGRVDGLRRLVDVVSREGWKRLGLALSVNAPNDEIRDQLMPLNRKWGMRELQEVILDLVKVRAGRKVLFEYVLIPGVNDQREHAEQLRAWLDPFVRTPDRPHIGLLNVIPYNPRRDSPWPAPSEASVQRFIDWMLDMGVFVKRRRTKGRSQMAACGQLGTAEIRGRRFTRLTANESPVG